jgi:hypothetical protein
MMPDLWLRTDPLHADRVRFRNTIDTTMITLEESLFPEE